MNGNYFNLYKDWSRFVNIYCNQMDFFFNFRYSFVSNYLNKVFENFFCSLVVSPDVYSDFLFYCRNPNSFFDSSLRIFE